MGNTEYAQWYVMRDLKRCNAKKPAYKQLQEAGVKVFVPLKWQIILQKGKKVREKVPVIQDLLFVYDSRQHLDSIVERTKTLQYHWYTLVQANITNPARLFYLLIIRQLQNTYQK